MDAVMEAVLVNWVPARATLLLIVPVRVIIPPAPPARLLTVQRKFGPPLVWVMRTPLPTVLLVTPVIVTLSGTLSVMTTPMATPGRVLVKRNV